ncbi:MAG: ATP-binding cassette domain-containing protein, partial [Gluconobacter oxydans]|uniref:ATP-binding cassette domain-containing protein n=1 Tax=Gluconobacter oxydans TaxID=442 RepID=UPI0039EBFC23
MTGLSQPRITLRDITRVFGSHRANDGISLEIERGSIHAFLGGNGAGKTTLMKILQGLEQPDSGEILFDGVSVSLSSPQDAFRHGVGMVQQEFSIIPQLTLLDNLILGAEPRSRWGQIDRKKARQDAERLASLAGVSIDWSLQAGDAPLHVRQIVEILRGLYRGSDILILDEPSAVLPREQVQNLLSLMCS